MSNKIKLICVNVNFRYKELLTKGKIYEGEESNISSGLSIIYYDSITNDRGDDKDTYLAVTDELDFIPSWITFIKLENWRQRQLNLIGV